MEFRKGEGDKNQSILEMDVHLHNAELLDQCIALLEKEDSLRLLSQLIEEKLHINANDPLALAVDNIRRDLTKALRKNELKPMTATRVIRLAYETLKDPTFSNKNVCANFIKYNEQGKMQGWKIFGGSFTVFIGLTLVIAGLVSSLTGNLCLGISLLATGIGFIGVGLTIAYQGKQTGLAQSFSQFFAAAEGVHAPRSSSTSLSVRN